MNRAAVFLFAAALAASALPARADIERKGTIGCDAEGNGQICLYIWPALPELAGWHRDEAASFEYKVAFMVPDGVEGISKIVIIGNVVPKDGYRTDHPGGSDLDNFIADDAVQTRKDNPSATITEVEPAVTADGKSLRTFTIRGIEGGHDQIVAFTEDGDADGKFFVILMLDALSHEALEGGIPAFRKMVGLYKHYKP